MTHRAQPLLYLAEPPARKTSSGVKISLLDHLLLLATFALLIGGCVLILDHASARSTGLEAQSGDWLVSASALLGSFGQMLGQYTALLGAGILSTLMIIGFVMALRLLDTAHSRYAGQISRGNEGGGITSSRILAKESGGIYLLSPVFQ